MLEELKLMLGLSGAEQDERLRLILDMATARLTLLLGGIAPPESMNHILLEVAIARFNRIGSEGLSSHNVEGESQTFAGSDFDGFRDEIQAFLDTRKETARGKVRFL